MVEEVEDSEAALRAAIERRHPQAARYREAMIALVSVIALLAILWGAVEAWR